MISKQDRLTYGLLTSGKIHNKKCPQINNLLCAHFSLYHTCLLPVLWYTNMCKNIYMWYKVLSSTCIHLFRLLLTAINLPNANLFYINMCAMAILSVLSAILLFTNHVLQTQDKMVEVSEKLNRWTRRAFFQNWLNLLELRKGSEQLPPVFIQGVTGGDRSVGFHLTPSKGGGAVP